MNMRIPRTVQFGFKAAIVIDRFRSFLNFKLIYGIKLESRKGFKDERTPPM